MRGVCAFDIDNTITCDQESARELIAWCKQSGFGVGIVTARPGDHAPCGWAELGLETRDVLPFAKGGYLHHNPDSYSQTESKRGAVKVDGLRRLQQQHGVDDRACVVLMDDLEANLTAARAAGFGAVRAGSAGGGGGTCGLGRSGVREAQRQLERCRGGGAAAP